MAHAAGRRALQLLTGRAGHRPLSGPLRLSAAAVSMRRETLELLAVVGAAAIIVATFAVLLAAIRAAYGA